MPRGGQQPADSRACTSSSLTERPRSISVEIKVGQDDLIAALLKGSGYRLGERNLSRSGQKMKKGRAEAYA